MENPKYIELLVQAKAIRNWPFLMLLIILVSNTSSNAKSETSDVPSAYLYQTYSRNLTIRDQTVTYTYNIKSVRNYNSGARYYMRNLRRPVYTNKLTLAYPYRYESRFSSYASGFGYRLINDPTVYKFNYSGEQLYYFPPMFQYYYFNNSKYWQDGKARYLCRNDKALWLLENQTSDFYLGKLPMVRLEVFDQVMKDPPEDDDEYLVPIQWQLDDDDVNRTKYWTVMDSLYIHEQLKLARSMNRSPTLNLSLWTFKGNSAFKRYDKDTSSVFSYGRTLRAYNYFACPDGQDPEEIYCCGFPEAGFCCTYEQHSGVRNDAWILLLVAAVIIGIVVLVLVCLCVKRLRNRYCPCCCACCCPVEPLRTRPNHTVTMVTTATQPYPTATYSIAPYPTNVGYQPVATTYGINSVPTYPSPTSATSNVVIGFRPPPDANVPSSNVVQRDAQLDPPTYDSVMQSHGFLSSSNDAPYSSVSATPAYVSASDYLATATKANETAHSDTANSS